MAPQDQTADDDIDPVDREAAEIDARSPDAAEQIQDLKDDAEALGRDVDG